MGVSVGTGIGVDVAVGIGSGVGARVGIGSLVGIGADVGMDVGAMVAAGSDVGYVSPQATISRTQKSAENSGSDRRFLANIGKIESTLTLNLQDISQIHLECKSGDGAIQSETERRTAILHADFTCR